ncbi:MAG: PhoH family protein [Desulfobacterales bacterium]|jgi:PhoH-like ATPase|nr:PhoH family protein [Desulfobacterales bacterium]
MANRKKKNFVLDTNVILHDSSCLYQFDEHNVVIPISVIEELDGFKRGKETIHCNAREFLRNLDMLSGDKLFNGGVSIGSGKGKVSIHLGGEFHEKLKMNFSVGKSDHHILNTAYRIAEKTSFEQTVLVTKDVNLRMKAKSIGLKAEDYTTDHVKNISEIYKGRHVLEDFPLPAIEQLYQLPFETPLPEALSREPLMPNEYLIMKNGSVSALGVFDPAIGKIRRIESKPCSGVKARNAEQVFALDALMNRNIPLVTLTGKAGTGKTLVALAAALESKKFYRQIFLARPAVPLSNKDIGFLPGDIKSKLDPYMQPLFDNLSVIENRPCGDSNRKMQVKELLDSEKIIITPLSYIRGRSIVKVFFIVDEAQNLTPHEVKTIITRAGEGTKIVLTGDIFQIDHPYLDSQSNGLSYLIERMKGQKLYAHVNLEKGERSELSELAISLL